jgi:hypothetical protein
MEVSGQLHSPAASPSGEKKTNTHWIGGWMGPRAGLDAVVKRKIPSLRRESNPDHPIVQRSVDVDCESTELSEVLRALFVTAPLLFKLSGCLT